jgi:hypothetical protein
VIDFTGKQIFAEEFDAEEVNYGIRILPREYMRDGIYLLLINHNGEVTQQRISIKH